MTTLHDRWYYDAAGVRLRARYEAAMHAAAAPDADDDAYAALDAADGTLSAWEVYGDATGLAR